MEIILRRPRVSTNLKAKNANPEDLKPSAQIFTFKWPVYLMLSPIYLANAL